ncbi:MAG TPA: hypothetical protein VGC81_16475 [Candidatus Methylomirabilis sp.]|jgi:hypothetical protein
MRRIWVAAVVALAWVVMAAHARADTVYLKDGKSIWGTDTYEEGDSVIVVRPGGEVKIPKGEVSRIERSRSSLLPHYVLPGTAPGPSSGGSGDATPPPAGSPATSPGGPAPSPGGPTALPPAPTPPPPPGTPR